MALSAHWVTSEGWEKGSGSQSTGLKGSAANSLVQDSTGHPQRFCVQASAWQCQVLSIGESCSGTSHKCLIGFRFRVWSGFGGQVDALNPAWRGPLPSGMSLVCQSVWVAGAWQVTFPWMPGSRFRVRTLALWSISTHPIMSFNVITDQRMSTQ